MRELIFDPFAGISGDMILGGLVDLGLDPAWLRDFVGSLGLGEIGVEVTRVERRGIACAQVRFDLPHEHAHRHLADVLRIVDRAAAPPGVRSRAAAVFRRLAEAEAGIHGVPVERVHFHEVGALDAILDVLCAIAGVEELGFERFSTRPVELGSGWIQIEHGRFPVPAPAALKLLEGLPVRESGFAGECTTPTGAAILAELTAGRTAPDTFVLLSSGFGAGSRDPEDRPNCLRLIAAEVPDRSGGLLLVQADVDDLAPEYAPPAQEAVLAAGALDAVVVPLAMKKGRPGLRLEALVPDAAIDAVLGALFRTTPTIGVRYWPVVRPALRRAEQVREWRGQTIRFKQVWLPDGTCRFKPEYEDVVRAANALGLAPYQVRATLEAEGVADDDPRP